LARWFFLSTKKKRLAKNKEKKLRARLEMKRIGKGENALLFFFVEKKRRANFNPESIFYGSELYFDEIK